MKARECLRWCLALTLAILGSRVAEASFHMTQIEQVIGGVCGDTAVQAIQLRARAGGQNFVSGAKLVAYDAAGLNPIVLLTFPGDVANGVAGSRILITSSEFSNEFQPPPDFTLTNLIPTSYLPAGRLTFESNIGTIYWSLAWGGAAYTGSTTGNIINDDDGDFGPPFDGPLPSSTGRALQFQGNADALSMTNADDYAVTMGDAVFTNNAGVSGTVTGCVFGDRFASGDTSAWSDSVP